MPKGTPTTVQDRPSARARLSTRIATKLSLRARDRLDHFEALELGVPAIERPVRPGVAVCQPKRLRPGPGFEIGPALPQAVRRIEDMIIALGAAQEVKGDKAGDAAQVAVAGRPDPLEL